MKPIRILFVIFLSALFSGLRAEVLAESNHIKLDVGDWPPYISFESPGVLQLVVDEIFAKVGVETKHLQKSWVRAEFDIDNNDAYSYGWIRNSEREDKWHFSDPVMSITNVFVSRKSKPIIWNELNDLKPYVIATARGYSYGNDFDKLKPQLKIFETNTENIGIKMLIHGRVDMVVIDSIVAKQILSDNHTPQEAAQLHFAMNKPVTESKLHFVCSIKNVACPQWIARFNAGLARLKESGELNQIIRSYSNH